MKIIAEVIQKIKEYQKTGLKKEEPFNKFIFKPLKNEKSGFLMY